MRVSLIREVSTIKDVSNREVPQKITKTPKVIGYYNSFYLQKNRQARLYDLNMKEQFSLENTRDAIGIR